MSKKAKRYLMIVVCVLCSLVVIAAAGYFIYGNTLININSEKSLFNHFAAEDSDGIEIIKIEKYDGGAGILFFDSVDKDKNMIHFREVVEHKYYKNRYVLKSSRNTNTSIEFSKIGETGNRFFVITNYNLDTPNIVKDEVISLFEVGIGIEFFEFKRKIGEITLSTKPDMKIQQFELEDEKNDVAYEYGSISLEEVKANYNLP